MWSPTLRRRNLYPMLLAPQWVAAALAFAGQSKAAWHDTMYYMYWAYYCAIANGTTSSDEDIAECASDEAGNGEVEVEWRWRGCRGYDV